jgi:hypothetical protein
VGHLIEYRNYHVNVNHKYPSKELKILTYLTHVCNGKDRVEHFSLLTMMVALRFHTLISPKRGKRLLNDRPKVPSNPLPNRTLIELDVSR